MIALLVAGRVYHGSWAWIARDDDRDRLGTYCNAEQSILHPTDLGSCGGGVKGDGGQGILLPVVSFQVLMNH